MDTQLNSIKRSSIDLNENQKEDKMQEKDRHILPIAIREHLQYLSSVLMTFIVSKILIMRTLELTLGWDVDFFQNKWQQLVDRYPYPVLFIPIGGFIVTNVVYWVCGAFFSILDITGWLSRYKVQPDTNTPLDMVKFIKGVLYVLFNQTLIGIPTAFAAYYITVYGRRAMPIEEIRILPSFTRVLLDFVFSLLTHEIGFYYSHRLLHHKSIYKYVHKVHHEWPAPIGVMAAYAHPIEHISSNMVPHMIGPGILVVHPVSLYFWFTFTMYRAIVNHSGYHLPFLSSTEQHDFHHFSFNQNYGALGLLDNFHGTDVKWRQSVNKKRHKPVYGFVPVRELFPDHKER